MRLVLAGVLITSGRPSSRILARHAFRSDEQQLTRCQILADAVHPHTSAEAQAQRTGDGWNNVGRAESRTKINKDNPILERVDQVGGDGERQSRLARATSANQREQARLRAKQQRADVGYL